MTAEGTPFWEAWTRRCVTSDMQRHRKTLPYIAFTYLPSVLWCYWLGSRKGIRPVKNEWWGAGMVICLERGADLHTTQLMPLPLTVSCFSKIQIGFTFLVLAHPGSHRKWAVRWVCVCVLTLTSNHILMIGQESKLLRPSEASFLVRPDSVTLMESAKAVKHCCICRIWLQPAIIQGLLERGCPSGRSSCSANHVVRCGHSTQPTVGVVWIQLCRWSQLL